MQSAVFSVDECQRSLMQARMATKLGHHQAAEAVLSSTIARVASPGRSDFRREPASVASDSSALMPAGSATVRACGQDAAEAELGQAGCPSPSPIARPPTLPDALLPEALPTLVALRSARSACLLALGRNEEALAEALQCVQLDPGAAVLWTLLGQTQRRVGHVHAALAAYGRALALDPGSAEACKGVELARAECQQVQSHRAGSRMGEEGPSSGDEDQA